LIYDDNYPHLYMKCSPMFEVIVPPTPAPTQAPTPAPTPLPTQVPTPTPTQTQAPTVTPWEQIGEDILGEELYNTLGDDLALSSDGTRLVACGRLEARAYHYFNDNWEQFGSTLLRSLDIIGAVAISSDGSRIVISENDYYNNAPMPYMVKVYKWNEVWDQVGSDIVGETNYNYANSLSISADGTIVAIGFSNYEGYDEGNVKVYEEDNGDWSKLGETIDCGPFSTEVSLSSDGMTLAVGSIEEYKDTLELSVYQYSSSEWTEVAIDFLTFECSELSVSLSADGTTVAVGGAYRKLGTVMVYNYDDTLNKWSQKGLTLNGNGTSIVSISGDGNRLAVGSPYGFKEKVTIYQYSADDGIWYSIHDEIMTDGKWYFGTAVSISADGSRVAISGPERNSQAGFIRVLSEPN